MPVHIELIEPIEKTQGYASPKQPANTLDLYRNAVAEFEKWPNLNMVVWKVLRSSVNWKQPANERRLVIDGCRINVRVIGSVGDWWFVSSEASKIVDALTVR